MPRSKRYTQVKALVDPKKLYPVEEAVELVKKTSTTKFESSVEAHMRLGIDVRQGEQQIRTTIILPHTIGKTKKIAAFVSSGKEQEAKDAGADIIGNEELIAEIVQTGKIDFDMAIATPDMMPKLAKVAKILGPKGLMPNPRTETVGNDVKKMIGELKRGKITIKNDATGNIHQAIGKTSLSTAQLIENFTALLEAVRKAKPASSKGVYFRKVVLTSTMGPSVQIEIKN
jgi:large subunit ribosomal protein L1